MDTSSFASATLLLKIIIPSEGTSKTIRVDTKTKVWELQETIKKKINVTHNNNTTTTNNNNSGVIISGGGSGGNSGEGEIQFGLYWYSDSGPVWLSDGTTLKSYNMKNGDSLEYKKRPPKLSRGTLPVPYLASSGDPIPLPNTPHSSISRDLPPLPTSSRQTISSPSTSTSTSSSPPTSLLSHTSTASRSNTKLEVKGKSNSWVTVRAGTTVYAPPSSSPARTNSSPSINNSTTNFNPPPPSDLKISMSELDGLIDSFDNDEMLQSGGDYEGDEINSSRNNNNDGGYLLDDNDNNGSLSFNNMGKSDGGSEGNSYTYEDVPSYSERRSDDNDYDNDIDDNYNYTTSYNTSSKSSLKNSDNFDDKVEKNSEYAPPGGAVQASMEVYMKAQQQKMIEDRVNIKVVERILEDAFGGIEDGVIEMDMVKMYISSALTILKSI